VAVAPIEAYATSQVSVADAQSAVRDTGTKQKCCTRLAELQARRTLNQHLAPLKQRIETLKEIAVLDAAADKLSTKSISMQLQKLQEAEITERLRTVRDGDSPQPASCATSSSCRRTAACATASLASGSSSSRDAMARETASSWAR
jgi:hypothetical protein